MENSSVRIIPGANPQANYRANKHEIDAAIQRVLDGPSYILGEYVSNFEKEFADYIGVEHCVGVNSGTDAIVLALKSCGIGPGHEVITVSHTAVATVAAIEICGATPVFADIHTEVYTVDPVQVQSLITESTKAVIAVHLYGHPADVVHLRSLCDKNGLILIEDCAQAHDAMINGKKIGTFGHLSAYSFYPTKNLGAIGDAGAVTTDNDDFADRLRKLRQYGWEVPQYSVLPGVNSRMDPLQAAILSVKLKQLQSDTDCRRRLARAYTSSLTGLPIVTPVELDGCRHVYHLYVIRLIDPGQRNSLRKYLSDRGITTGIHYEYAVHEQPAYKDRIRYTSLDKTEMVCRSILSLPMYPEMSNDDTDYIISTLRNYYN